MKETFNILGVNYEINEFGVITQLDPKPFVYDAKYSSTYDTFSYKKGSNILQAMRYGFACASHGEYIESILDCGYGNGDFMVFARQHTKLVVGYDVTGVEVDQCVITKDFNTFKNSEVDVLTFWDCLEHFFNIDFLEIVKAKTICISLPYCKFANIEHSNSRAAAIEWFYNWKHRKPDEHIRHFNRSSLTKTMKHYGWIKVVGYSHHEDIVRINSAPMNILTMAFKRD